MKDHTTSCTVTATLTEAELFKRFLDAPPRVGEEPFAPTWSDDDLLTTTRDWFVRHAGWGEYPLDGDWAERLLSELEGSDWPSQDMWQLAGSLQDAADAMRALLDAFDILAETCREPRPAEDAPPEVIREWENKPKYAVPTAA